MPLTSRHNKAKKRTLDLLLGTPLLLISLPIQLVVAILVRFSSKGPVIHRANRVGRNGNEFIMLKFRTMRIGLRGTLVTASDDPRITRVGRFLRSSKLDELPQLFQVVRGTMSLVGRRPEDPRHVANYTPEQMKVFQVPPALTGPAVVVNEEEILTGFPPEEVESKYISEFVPDKVQINLNYLENWKLKTDLMILFRTVISLTPGLNIRSKRQKTIFE